MFDDLKKCIKSVNFFLKLIGLSLDMKDDQRTIFKRFCKHSIYAINFICMTFQVVAEVLWLFEAIKNKKSFLEITFVIPCLTFCLLSMLKTFCMLVCAPCVNEVLQKLNSLQSVLSSSQTERKAFVTKLIDVHISKINNISNSLKYLIIMGLLMFVSEPLLISLAQYYNTGEVELALPFYGYYPFDVYDLKYFICVYFYQSWTTFIAIYFVYGPNYLFFTCCSFLHIQFLLLQYDMERVVIEDVKKPGNDNFKWNIRNVATRHIELMRCVDLLETTYSMSILFDALTSSIIICVTGFNIMANDNILTMASFTSFLSFSLIQIFLYCYYGDNIMRSSTQVSDAIYNSKWYYTDAKERRSFFIILIRAQKPCKITAYNFFDINLVAFTNILSTSWSYFALLKTMYHPE